MSEIKNNIFGKAFTAFVLLFSLIEIGVAIFALVKGKLKFSDIKIKMKSKGMISMALVIVANLLMISLLICMLKIKTFLSSKAPLKLLPILFVGAMMSAAEYMVFRKVTNLKFPVIWVIYVALYLAYWFVTYLRPYSPSKESARLEP